MINSLRSYIITACAVSFFFLSCTTKKISSDTIDLSLLKEGDTLLVKNIPSNLGLWMEYHSLNDSKISLNDFICSGVILHQGELSLLDSSVNIIPPDRKKFLVFSPDKSKFIDLFSLTRKNDVVSDTLLLPYATDIDQQVVVGYEDGRRSELFFCGPEQLVASADWLNEDQVILTISSFKDSVHIVELYLIDLSKGIFTNFLLKKQLDKKVDQKSSFIDYWLSIMADKT